jgi:hypothetical protein
MPDPDLDRLVEISERLEQAAERLRTADDGEEASQLAGECAELASTAAAELDRLAKSTPGDPASGQEELL